MESVFCHFSLPLSALFLFLTANMQFEPQPRWQNFKYYSISKTHGGQMSTSRHFPGGDWRLRYNLALIKFASPHQAHWGRELFYLHFVCFEPTSTSRAVLIRAQGVERGEIHHVVDPDANSGETYMKYEFAFGACPEDSDKLASCETLGSFPGSNLQMVRHILEGVLPPHPDVGNCQDWVAEGLDDLAACDLVITRQVAQRVREEIEPKPRLSRPLS